MTRSTYAFAGVFPFFAAERLARRARRGLSRSGGGQHPVDTVSLPELPRTLERLFLWLSGKEAAMLSRRHLPFSCSVVLTAVKP